MKRAFEFVDEKSHKFWWIESFEEKFWRQRKNIF